MKYLAKELGFIRRMGKAGVMKSVAIEKGEVFELPEGQKRRPWMLDIPSEAKVEKAKPTSKEPEQGSFKAK
jgi:hypothetical protein